jgi:hypothetical protein
MYAGMRAEDGNHLPLPLSPVTASSCILALTSARLKEIIVLSKKMDPAAVGESVRPVFSTWAAGPAQNGSSSPLPFVKLAVSLTFEFTRRRRRSSAMNG